jgi:outer membrane protein assembly factor BamE (lipoprotein component of BamABCDE complex)
MKRISTMLLTGAALALPVMAVAAPKIAYYRDTPVKSIYAGETQDDVRSALGSPASTREVSGTTHYYYRVEDNFGERSWLDVAFDPNGLVVTKGELRMDGGS